MATATATTSTAANSPKRKTLVLDNGAYSMKVGMLHHSEDPLETPQVRSTCLNVPNFIARAKGERRRVYISAEIKDCVDTSGLYLLLPFEKGYMCAVDIQKRIWDYMFGAEGLRIDFSQTDLVITEPMFNFASVRKVMCDMLFEDYGFHSVCLTTAAHLADYGYLISREENSPTTQAQTDRPKAVCTMIVDSGYSFTHVAPFINGLLVKNAVRRIDVGGKLLTNQLKEIISYRQMNVMDEPYLINQVKEDLCFVSCDIASDMAHAQKKLLDNKIHREYVMPDFVSADRKRGFIRPEAEVGKKSSNFEQVLRMNNERFSVPEVLFHPSDIGINQMGIPDLLHEVIKGFPKEVQPHLYKNILLIGGNVNIPGFRDRVYNELRKLAPVEFDIRVIVPVDTICCAGHGGNRLIENGGLPMFTVTREQYAAKGMAAFPSW